MKASGNFAFPGQFYSYWPQRHSGEIAMIGPQQWEVPVKIAKALGYLTLATIVASVLVNLSDIRRYIRISNM
jgi:uncharacterized protein DUF6893